MGGRLIFLMLSQSKNTTLAVVCCIAIILTAVLHIAFGALYIQGGAYIQNNYPQIPYLSYQNTLPLGGFVIVVGIFFILANSWLAYVLMNSELLSLTVERTIWVLGWMNVVFGFAVSFMEVWEYSRWNQLFAVIPVDPRSLNSAIYTPFYFCLADGIITFVLAFPLGLVLLHMLNERLIQSEERYAIKIVAFEVTEESKAINKGLARQQARAQDGESDDIKEGKLEEIIRQSQ